SCTHCGARDNAITKTWSESLDLRFDLIRHIRIAVEWNMAVRPKRVLTTRCACFIEQTLLRNQHKRALRNFSAHKLTFHGCDLINCAAEMNCACSTASSGLPCDRCTQRIIDFENSRRVSKRFQASAISRWQLMTGYSQKFPDRNVQKSRARFRQVVQIFDAMIDFDLPTELTQITCER